jgi:uncharacterized membrane protein
MIQWLHAFLPPAKARWVLTAGLVVAGLAHFVIADFFAAWVPPQLGMPYFWVYISGVAELLLAVGVQLPRWRRFSGWLTVAMLSLYLWVHIYVIVANAAVNAGLVGTPWGIPLALAWVRLPFQLVLIVGTVYACQLWSQGCVLRKARGV